MWIYVLTVLIFISIYLLIAAATHGYAKYKFPPKFSWSGSSNDENFVQRELITSFWPIYWFIIYPICKVNDVTFSHFEKVSGAKIAANKVRIAELKATQEQLAISNAELEQANAELEKEIAKSL